MSNIKGEFMFVFQVKIRQQIKTNFSYYIDEVQPVMECEKKAPPLHGK
jgi:hypothetical protein